MAAATAPSERQFGGGDVLLAVDEDERIATITLNRPDRLNAISTHLPRALRNAVETADRHPAVNVIVLQGAGRAFCSGYDLQEFAEAPGENAGYQGGSGKPWDPLKDFANMHQNTNDFMSLFSALKPVIVKVHGFAVAGGSDIALCGDVVIMADDAKIGYPPARVWGCPTTFQWVYRLGPERAKRMLLTGDVIDGKEAERIGLVCQSVPTEELDAAVLRMARRMATVPANQLQMQKLVINNAVEALGIRQTQTLATLMDGIARHTPEGVAFKERCEAVGFKKAVQERDTGEFVFETAAKPRAKL
jgi:enoyl-CoA hydratase/carnithine racemase